MTKKKIPEIMSHENFTYQALKISKSKFQDPDWVFFIQQVSIFNHGKFHIRK